MTTQKWIVLTITGSVEPDRKPVDWRPPGVMPDRKEFSPPSLVLEVTVDENTNPDVSSNDVAKTIASNFTNAIARVKAEIVTEKEAPERERRLLLEKMNESVARVTQQINNLWERLIAMEKSFAKPTRKRSKKPTRKRSKKPTRKRSKRARS